MDHQINEDIRDPEVRLVDSDGAQLGVMPTHSAMDIAFNKDLDLVKIAPSAKPPVCRVMDYGKYRFEQSKKEKEARKSQHTVEVKEIRLSSGIDDHDFNFKLRNGLKFLQDGNKLKVSVRFRGRQMAHTSIGERQLLKFAGACAELAAIERPPKLEGRSMAMFMSPKPQTRAASQVAKQSSRQP
ncbi:MAG: translation initiation factor IF-3 [Oscillospiraceae bacterium]|nr:translation initiation factor IF-3 [Oscillospiraceae bacterium]